MIPNLRKNIIIDLTLIIAAAFSIAYGKIDLFILLFSVAIHEIGHIFSAILIGARSENFIIHGFGVELVFPGKTLMPNKMLLLAAGGPAASFILAFCARIFGFNQLYITNLSIAIINLLPVFPLDGGGILWGILSPHISRKVLRKLFRFLGKFIGIIVTLFGILILTISGFNISLIYLGLFIFFSSSRLQNPVTEITSAIYGKVEKCSIYLINNKIPLIEAAAYLPVNSIGAVRNDVGEITAFVTPTEIYLKASN